MRSKLLLLPSKTYWMGLEHTARYRKNWLASLEKLKIWTKWNWEFSHSKILITSFLSTTWAYTSECFLTLLLLSFFHLITKHQPCVVTFVRAVWCTFAKSITTCTSSYLQIVIFSTFTSTNFPSIGITNAFPVTSKL